MPVFGEIMDEKSDTYGLNVEGGEVLNRKLLESYKANERLIERNRRKIEEEKQREIPVVRGKVKGSSPDFPYIEQGFNVYMNEPEEADRQYKRIRRLEEEISRAERENEKIEQFINEISDVKDREIFQCRYLDGMKANEVGEVVGYTKGRVSQIIKKYLKD